MKYERLNRHKQAEARRFKKSNEPRNKYKQARREHLQAIRQHFKGIRRELLLIRQAKLTYKIEG